MQCKNCPKEIEDTGSQVKALQWRHMDGFFNCGGGPGHSNTFAEPQENVMTTDQAIEMGTEHAGAVCKECGRTVTGAEYSCGESICCKSEVVSEEEQ